MTATGVVASSTPRLVAPLVALVFFIQMLDSTIIATSLPQMAVDFDTTPVAMSIGLTSYLLAMAVVLPAAGWVGERFGERRVLVLAVLGFVLASLGCGWAGSLEAFVAARVLQGCAAAMMAPVGRMLVLRHAPKSELMAAIATITWPALIAPVIGPVLGAWITESLDWRWNFFLNLPLGLVAILLFLVLVPRPPRAVAQPFDRIGFLLSAGALLALLGGLELALTHTAQALPVLLLGLVLAMAALRHLMRHPAPLFDLRVCRIQTFRLATLTAGTLGRVTTNATPFLLPLLLQVGYGLAPLAAGQLVLVYFLGNLAMKGVTSRVLRRFGFRRVLAVNGSLAGGSIAALAVVNPAISLVAWAVLLFAGATRSLQFTALNTLAFADINAADRSSSATLAAMTQQIALLLGVTLAALAIRASVLWSGNPAEGLIDIRLAFFTMALIGLISALCFLRLAPDAGREVSGHLR